MYILDASEQAELIRGLVLIETLDEGWSRIYRNPVTGEKWLQTFVSSGHGGATILRNDPSPTTITEWLEMNFSSNRQDDVVGLALELSEKYETWADVVEYLEANQARLDADKIAIFLERMNVLNPSNRRSSLNKHYTEVEKDYQYFRDLSERARRLLNTA